jgi:protein-L-isoaspartate O-methyltransferase
MLSALQLKPHMSVLEIGTGTGWNAAILAARLGDEQVVSIEVDPQLAEDARIALAMADLKPLVVTGDGTEGYSLAAPYDRILATAATQQVPYAWVEQTKMGGLIVTPWGTAYHNGTLLKLHKTDDGATGHFGGNVGFMWLRGQRTPFGSVEDRVKDDHRYRTTTTTLYPYEPVSDFDGSFAVGLLVPDCQTTVVQDDEDDPLIVYLMDEASDSWATVTVDSESNGEYLVHQHGPRRLWDMVENAYAWWVGQGKPEHSRFGLTVIRNRQWVWLDKPTNEVLKSQGVDGRL